VRMQGYRWYIVITQAQETRTWRWNIGGVTNRWARDVSHVQPTPLVAPPWGGCGLGAPDE
jgi:hypothetical protein